MSAAASNRAPGALARWCVAAALTAAVAGPACAAEVGRVLAVCADPSNLPSSDEHEHGFENRIARLIADDLHASLRYTWNMQRRGFLRRTLNAGACDVVLGVPVGLQGVLQTRPYYTSSYVAVSARRRGLSWQGFDDPALRGLRIGLQVVGAEGANTPPANALARRGLVEHIVGYPMWGEENEASPQARIVDAVVSGEIDLAIVWGPFAGYFARPHGDALVLTPVEPDPQQPTLALSYAMALGVRRGDEALRDELQQVLDRHRPEIAAILREYGVPQAAATTTGE